MSAVFEDLGDLSLYSYLKCKRDIKQIEVIYKKIIDMLIIIHVKATVNVSECPFLMNRLFNYEHLRWETKYFIENFVKGIKKITINNDSSLLNEFHQLALKVDSFAKTVIHRDFQSQNIMITEGGIPRIIDYQGARMGPPAYDVVSILWDPYYRLDAVLRERLLDYYADRIKAIAEDRFERARFIDSLLFCRLQRHMQSLGAYGFLSSVKGKIFFLKYASEGLKLLQEDVSLAKDEYPVLYDLVMKL